jgi:hypothetical protein
LKQKITHLKEELEKVDVVWLLSEVLLQEVVDSSLEHESVIDSDVADIGLSSANNPVRGRGGRNGLVLNAPR